MRRIIAFIAAGALAVAVFAQVRGTDVLATFAKALNSAQSLSSTYTVGPVADIKASITVDLAKPNMARIDRDSQLIVADGKNITTYDKKAKTYFKTPQTQEGLIALFNGDELGLWAPFFDAKAYANIASAKSLGVKNRKGVNFNVVEVGVDKAGKKTVTLYINPQDNLARQAEMVLKDAGATDTVILDTKSLTLGSTNPTLFAFTPPEGSRELTAEEMNSDKWYTDLDDGIAAAKSSHRLVYVDFYADW
jgi:outer membrane lipoprotein-sorting protein